MSKIQKDSINDMKFLNMKKKSSSDILEQNPATNDEIKCSIL